MRSTNWRAVPALPRACSCYHAPVMHDSLPLILPRAILFDMDGTLTEPMLDFPRIKAEMGIGDRPILEALAEMDGERRAAAEAVLHRHEELAAAESKLN